MKYCKLLDGMYVGPLSKELRKKLPIWAEFDSESEALMTMGVPVVGSLKRLESFRDAIMTMLYRGGREYAVGVLYGNDLNVIQSYHKGTICVQATLVLDMSKAEDIINSFKRYLKEVGVFVALPKDPVVLLGMAYGVAIGDGDCSSYADVLEFYKDCSVRDEYLEDKILSLSDEGYAYPDFDKFVAADVVSGVTVPANEDNVVDTVSDAGDGSAGGGGSGVASGGGASQSEDEALESFVCRLDRVVRRLERLRVGHGFVDYVSRSENATLESCVCSLEKVTWRLEHLGMGRGFVVGHGCGCMMGGF